MQRSMLWWRSLVGASIAFGVVVAVNASGQAGKGQSVFGTVDVQRVTAEFKAMKLAQADLTAMQAKFQGRLARRDRMPFLTEEEHTQLDTLYEKDAAARTAAETTQMKDLEDKGAKVTSEIEALRQKPEKDLTDADRTRIKDAESQFLAAKNRFEAAKTDQETKLRDYGAANQEKLTKQFRASVAKIAEQKNVSIIFDSQVAIYAGTDITNQVLADLNK